MPALDGPLTKMPEMVARLDPLPPEAMPVIRLDALPPVAVIVPVFITAPSSLRLTPAAPEIEPELMTVLLRPARLTP